MEIDGNLEAMDLPTLIQFIGQNGNMAVVRLTNDSSKGDIYLKDGLLCHAELTRGDGSTQVGEEAVYEMLSWEKGRFKVQKEVVAPEVSMQEPWDFLLMEGLRLLDEGRLNSLNSAQENSFAEILSTTEVVVTEDKVSTTNLNKEIFDMSNLQETLDGLMHISGAKAAALVDWESGLTLGTIGSGMDIDLAAAGNTNVVRSKLEVMKGLKIKGGIEDILITLTDQIHLIRLLESSPNLFIYVALDRASANLGMARHQLVALEKELTI